MSGSTSFALRVAAFYGAIFTYIGIYIPFFPPFLETRGLGAFEIGIIMALPLGVRILATPLMTWFADRSGNPRAILIAYAVGVFASAAVYLVTRDFAATVAVTFVNAIFLNPVMPMTEAIALRGVRVYALDYGRMRLAGSATFIVGNLAGGAILAATGAGFAAWLMTGAAAALVLTGLMLPQTGSEEGLAERQAGFLSSMRAAANPLDLAVMAGLALVLSSHNLFYVFGTVHWAGQGINSATAGTLWAIGVVAEIILFAWSGAVGARLGTGGLVFLSVGCATVRWTAMVFDPPLVALYPLQVLHGFTFGATHLAAMRFLGERSGGKGVNSLQGLYFTLTGLCGCLVNFAAGPLYETFAAGSYAVMTVQALAGGALTLYGLRAMRDKWVSTP